MNDEWIEEKERDALFEELHQMPHFDSVSETWVLVTLNGKEEGDAIYIASEFVKGGLVYPFHSEPSWKEQYHDHEHEFTSVVEFLLQRPYYFMMRR